MKKFFILLFLLSACSGNQVENSVPSDQNLNNQISSTSSTTTSTLPITTTTSTLPSDVLDYLESISEMQKAVVTLEKKVTLDNKKWINNEITYLEAKELFLDNIETANVMFNKLISISSPVFSVSVTYLLPIVGIGWGVLDGELFSKFQWIFCLIF